ncbi:hypothetical protein [Microbulbifer epialgicus]|uniref:Uncharacterized protein n=1 Tax=Microbulbifer epialgicus TaxID=393907 RepID=A0ABV4NUH3_9GAMM
MNEVSLKELNFALPTRMDIDACDKHKIDSRTEFPQEFFGLDPKDQVSVIYALIHAAHLHIGRLEEGKTNEDSHENSINDGIGFFPVNICISISLKKTPTLEVGAIFNFPDSWINTPIEFKLKIIRSFAYLMQSSGISIVMRNEKYGEQRA